MRGLFIHELGACNIAPFKIKCIDPSIIAAGITTIGSLASAGMSSSAAGNLNDVNRDYDRKKTEWLANFNASESERARQAQRDLLSQQQNWEESMYNQYNSPSALRKQYEEAGYNPYLVSSQGLNGMSLGSPSASSVPNASAPSTGNPQTFMPDYSSVSSGISGAASMYLQGKQMQANIANTSAKTLKDGAEAYSSLREHGMSHEDAQRLVMPFFKGSQGLNADSDLFFNTMSLEFDRKVIARDKEQLEQQILDEFGRTEKADKVMLMEQEFDRIAKEIGYYASLGKLNDAKIDEIASSIVRNFAAAGLDSANASLINRSMDYLVKQSEFESKLSETNYRIQNGEYNLRKPVFDAAGTDFGQTVEQVDYYTDKIVNKASKLMKFNIGINRYRSDFK